MDARLLDILVCPVCKAELDYRKDARELICKPCRVAYPIPFFPLERYRQFHAESVQTTRNRFDRDPERARAVAGERTQRI